MKWTEETAHRAFVKVWAPYLNSNLSFEEAVKAAGYRMGDFVTHPIWSLRAAVAARGYGLDTLADDEDEFVRRAARNKLNEMSSAKAEEA